MQADLLLALGMPSLIHSMLNRAESDASAEPPTAPASSVPTAPTRPPALPPRGLAAMVPERVRPQRRDEELRQQHCVLFRNPINRRFCHESLEPARNGFRLPGRFAGHGRRRSAHTTSRRFFRESSRNFLSADLKDHGIRTAPLIGNWSSRRMTATRRYVPWSFVVLVVGE